MSPVASLDAEARLQVDGWLLLRYSVSLLSDDPDYDTHAIADSPRKPPPSSANANANAKTDAPAAPTPLAAAFARRGGAAGAPVDLGAVLGHPTPNLRDLYALGRKFGATCLCTDLATGVDYACTSISMRSAVSFSHWLSAR